MQPKEIFLLLVIGVAGGLVWAAVKRPGRQRLVARVLASLVAPLSLYGLLYPPLSYRPQVPSTGILLTPGYHPDTLRYLLRTIRPVPKIWRYRVAAPAAAEVISLAGFRQKHPAMDTLHVLGYGLPSEELHPLTDLTIRPHLSVPAGVVFADWNREIFLGQPLVVAGQYRSATAAPVWLRLAVAGQGQDSVKLSGGGSQTFSLKYTPKVAGQFVHQLAVKTATGKVTAEPVPVTITEPAPLNILLLAATPGFEFKFLKNALADQRHRVASRTRISRDKYQTEYRNLNPVNIAQLTPAVLQRFDAVITDPAALTDLTLTERQTLQRAVGADGIGLLVLVSELPLPALPLLQPFSFRREAALGTRTRVVQWLNQTTGHPITTLPYAIIQTTKIKSWARDEKAQTVVAAYRYRRGQVAVSILPATYRWQLAGQQATYQAFWAALLTPLARKKNPVQTWQLPSAALPHEQQPVALTLADYSPAPGVAPVPVGTVVAPDTATTQVFLKQAALVPYRFTGVYWPRQAGWHLIRAADATPFSFYVFGAKDWLARQQAHHHSQTLAWLAEPRPSQQRAAVPPAPVPVLPIYFFLLFLLAVGFLWLEERW